jgi:hypothetical protein
MTFPGPAADTPHAKRHVSQTLGAGEGVKGQSRRAGARSAALEAFVLTQHHEAAVRLSEPPGALTGRQP